MNVKCKGQLPFSYIHKWQKNKIYIDYYETCCSNSKKNQKKQIPEAIICIAFNIFNVWTDWYGLLQFQWINSHTHTVIRYGPMKLTIFFEKIYFHKALNWCTQTMEMFVRFEQKMHLAHVLADISKETITISGELIRKR